MPMHPKHPSAEPRGATSPHHADPVVDGVIQRLEATNAVREQVLRAGRHLTRTSANAIRALHRGDRQSAADLLREAATSLDAIVEVGIAHPSVYWAGHAQDAMKEYAEAAITAALLDGLPIPTPDALHVEDASYLNGLAEAASELRRDCLDALRRDDTDTAVRLLETMDAIYAELVTVDFADAVTGGLRRTTDQLRAVLERTRGDVTMSVRQDRLERALRSIEPAVRSRD